MNGVRLLTKDGGKRGHWTRDTPNAQTAPAHTFTSARSATVLVASTGGANGTRPDTTGPTIATWLRERDFEVRGPLVYADAAIAAGIADAKEGSDRNRVVSGKRMESRVVFGGRRKLKTKKKNDKHIE